MFKVKIEVNQCTRCPRTETSRWYYKMTDSPICGSCYRKDYVSKNREKALESQRKANQSEKSKKARKEYAKSASGRIIKRNYDRKYHHENPDKIRAKRKKLKGYYSDYLARRNRNLEKAALGGLWEVETRRVYQETPEGHHVDHIIPVKAYNIVEGERIHVACGLHVPWNLQYLPAKQNLQKSCNLYSLEDLQ